MRKVDITIPIYNGYDFVKECIESVLIHDSSIINTIHIIDDASTDSNLIRYYKKINKHKKINLIQNNENKGFVHGANKGMIEAVANNTDVILLNSDTVVTSGWVEKMQTAAYSKENICSVTPLSNDGYLTSVPKLAVHNEIPENLTLKEYAEIIDHYSFKEYPTLPVGNGFCMYITKDCLDEVGYFDEELFGKGYGEEVDFCLRARELDYINLCADDTFIYHKGSASFNHFTKKNRDERVKVSTRILNKKYSFFENEISTFIEDDPLKDIRSNIKFRVKFSEVFNNRTNIIMIKHYEETVGGVGVHTEELARNLSNTFNIYILNPGKNGLELTKFIDGKKYETITFVTNSPEDFLKTIVHQLNINLIHFHHLSLPAKEAFNIPTILTTHDFHFINGDPHLKIVNKKNEIYYFKDFSDYASSFNSDTKKALIIKTKERLKRFDKVITVSDYMNTQVQNFVPKEKIITIEPGTNLQKTTQSIEINRKDKINVAFLGNGFEHKGFITFLKLIKDAELCDSFNWYLIGQESPNLNKLLQLNNVKDKYKSRVTVTGAYKNYKLPEIFSNLNIHLNLILSEFQETYSIILSESAQNNIPVIGRNMGALGDRIKKNNYGWTFSSEQELKKLLIKLSANPHKLEEKSKNISEQNPIASTKEIAKSHKDIYNDLIEEPKKLTPNKGLNKNFFKAYKHAKKRSRKTLLTKKIPLVGKFLYKKLLKLNHYLHLSGIKK